MDNFITLAFLMPLLSFCLNIILLKKEKIQKGVTILVSFTHLLFSTYVIYLVSEKGPLVLNSGGWEAPFGITLAIDIISSIMLFATGVIYFGSAVYSSHGKTCEKSPFFFPLLNMLFAGISGAFITSDLFNLYVWFEIILLSSFVLMGLETSKARLGGNLKYIVLNLLSSLLFLLGVGLVYSATGALNFQFLQSKLQNLSGTNPEYVLLINLVLFSAFAIKSGLFPFYQWLGASYPHSSPALSGVFAGMLTKVGLYAIFRINGLLFPSHEYFYLLIGVIPAFTMVAGVFNAITQNEIRRILSFHVISQVGYIAIAVYALGSQVREVREVALIAGFFYAFHHIIVKTNLFFVSGIVKHCYGSEDIKEVSHVRYSSPFLAVLFAIPGLSLAGLPPSSGFWAKLSLFQLILPLENYFAIFCMVLAGFFTLFSMVKIWIGVFWGDGKEAPPRSNPMPLLPVLASAFLGTVSLVLAFAPGYMLEILKKGVSQVLLL